MGIKKMKIKRIHRTKVTFRKILYLFCPQYNYFFVEVFMNSIKLLVHEILLKEIVSIKILNVKATTVYPLSVTSNIYLQNKHI